MIAGLVKNVKLKLPTSNSSTTMELADGRTEELHFTQVRPTEFTVSDSDFSIKSGVRVELDIQNIDLVATSELLWPGQTIRVRGGLDAQGSCLKGQVTIPLGKRITDGVDGESWLYWAIETPQGVWRNVNPIHMKGKVKGLPPQDTEFRSSGIIPLYDEQGEHIATIYNCCQSS